MLILICSQGFSSLGQLILVPYYVVSVSNVFYCCDEKKKTRENVFLAPSSGELPLQEEGNN